jgi:hypothetical protein
MDRQHVPIGAIQPGEDEKLVTRLNAAQPVQDLRLEVEPGVRRTLVALLWGGIEVPQRRLDPADCPNVEGQRYGLVSQSMIGWA